MNSATVTPIELSPKICYTAAGILIHQDRVLLIKHKKLGIWLNPGGHIEPGELPHQAAEREFFEETGVRTKAMSLPGYTIAQSQGEPHPVATNLHWISQENYEKRRKSGQEILTDPVSLWPKGCEQHFNFLFLLSPEEKEPALQANNQETTDISWFSRDEIRNLQDLKPTVRQEIEHVFSLVG